MIKSSRAEFSTSAMFRKYPYSAVILLLAPILLMCSATHQRVAEAFESSPVLLRPSKTISINSDPTTSTTGIGRHSQLSRIRRRNKAPSTVQRMVLTTPESIIEQASTQNLLDDLIDESVRTSARRPIMMQFDPSSGWIWRRWKGTVFSETWTSCVKNMAIAVIVLMIYKTNPGLKNYLSGFGTLWAQLLSVTTFTLTFFVNQSYALWRKCSELSRRLQGRLHDVGLNLATHAARKSPSNPDEPSTYTPAARQVLELMSRYIRLFNLLTYASFTRSHRPILTPRGMRRLVERGLMTPLEREVLTEASIPGTQRHSAILMWMMRLFHEGRASGHILGGDGFEQQTIEKFHIIRSQYGAIGDELQGRMPLAYAHIVQILVDLILWMYPLMALSSGVSPLLTIIGAGLLTLSYQGLFDLAKQFLDPYDNENYGKGEDPLCVDTLIAETNAGSVRWMYGFEEMPFNAQRLKDGELYDYLLPVRGYNVEELAQMEEERIKKEKEKEEQRKREEALREEQEEAQRNEIDVLQHEEEESAALSLLADESQLIQISNSTVDEVVDEAVSLGNEQLDLSQNSTAAKGVEKDVALNVTNQGEPTKQIHKVTTLAGGKPFSYQKAPKEKVDMQTPPVPVATTNYLASLQGRNAEETKRRIVQKAAEDTFVPDLSNVDFGMFDELPNWFDEVNEDGQEVRLSQMLAEEEWKEANETKPVALTFDEYSKKAAEIIENVQNELIETEEIMKAEPGAQEYDEKLQALAEKKRESPVYDQTRLDGISQLWGLPPEDPDAFTELADPESVEDMNFDAITQLWGGSGSSDIQQEDDEIVGMSSFGGISELWGESVVNGVEGVDSTEGEDSSGNNDDNNLKSVYPELWYDETGPDGKELRLSEMLADEEWEGSESPASEEAPMTLEDYNSQVSEILAAAEEELLETEAILLAAPGSDPLGWDYDEDVLMPTTNATQVEETGDLNEDPEATDSEGVPIAQADLDILEMDKDETVFSADSDIEPSPSVEKDLPGVQVESAYNETSQILDGGEESDDAGDGGAFEKEEPPASDRPQELRKNTDKVQPILVNEDPEYDSSEDQHEAGNQDGDDSTAKSPLLESDSDINELADTIDLDEGDKKSKEIQDEPPNTSS